mmetsp:Transcript_34639/g.72888  ORF Transcript_34639/g.72888 Transcript_34639/m.72888 type:complete len:221 (+) Transcript_34639:1-663(+)
MGELKKMRFVRSARLWQRQRGHPPSSWDGVEGLRAHPADGAHVSARRVGGDDGHLHLARVLDQLAVVLVIVGPRPRVHEEIGLAYEAAQVFVEHVLHVALEHLEGERARARLLDRDEQEQLELVRHGVVVRLPEQDNISLDRRAHDLGEADTLAGTRVHCKVARLSPERRGGWQRDVGQLRRCFTWDVSRQGHGGWWRWLRDCLTTKTEHGACTRRCCRH